MKKNLNDILPGVGLGNLKFGMNKEAVAKLLGKPDDFEVFYDNSSEDFENEHWHYDDLELSVSFSEIDDWRMDTIGINSADYQYSGNEYYGKKMQRVKMLLIEAGIRDFEEEDWSSIESPDHKLISVDRLALNFWFDNGICAEVQWSPLLDENRNNIYPK